MTDPTVTNPAEVDLLAPEQVKCPWHSYEVLREQAPVWQDPRTGFYVVSRYDDVREVLLNSQLFAANLSEGDDTARPEIRELYEREGMLPAVSLSGLDDPYHRQVRKLMDEAFRPRRIASFEPFIEQVCQELIDGFIDRGEVDLAQEFAQEMAMRVMLQMMGLPPEDGPKIRAWTDAWIARIAMTMTPEEELWSCEQEIAAQQYFQPIIDRVRAKPEENLLSDIVNGVVPEWGEGLSDAQIQIELLVDMFTGGTQTSGHGVTSAVKIWIERPDLLATVRSDPERWLQPFIEEVLRTDGPQQGNPRIATEDTEIAGVKIPKGATVHARWGASNRDPRRFGETADQIDLERPQNRTHLAFGVGTHHCIGATLARRELWYALKAILDNFDDFWLLDDGAGLEYVESYIVRGLSKMPVGFVPRPGRPSGTAA